MTHILDPDDNHAPTAANAAVRLQRAEDGSLKQSDEPLPSAAALAAPVGNEGVGGAVVRLPFTVLRDQVAEAIAPTIEIFSVRKNVAVTPDELGPLARYALEHLPRKTLRRILAVDAAAIEQMQQAVDHALDVLGAARLIAALTAAEGRLVPDAATLIVRGEQVMRSQVANDKAWVMRIWPDPVAMAVEHHKRISQQGALPPVLTLPESATIRCTVRTPGKQWGVVVDAATPDTSELQYE